MTEIQALQCKMETLLQTITNLQVDLFHRYDKHKEQQALTLKYKAAHLGTQLALQQITRNV